MQQGVWHCHPVAVALTVKRGGITGHVLHEEVAGGQPELVTDIDHKPLYRCSVAYGDCLTSTPRLTEPPAACLAPVLTINHCTDVLSLTETALRQRHDLKTRLLPVWRNSHVIRFVHRLPPQTVGGCCCQSEPVSKRSVRCPLEYNQNTNSG